jgi:hypothetical protein
VRDHSSGHAFAGEDLHLAPHLLRASICAVSLAMKTRRRAIGNGMIDALPAAGVGSVRFMASNPRTPPRPAAGGGVMTLVPS